MSSRAPRRRSASSTWRSKTDPAGPSTAMRAVPSTLARPGPARVDAVAAVQLDLHPRRRAVGRERPSSRPIQCGCQPISKPRATSRAERCSVGVGSTDQHAILGHAGLAARGDRRGAPAPRAASEGNAMSSLWAATVHTPGSSCASAPRAIHDRCPATAAATSSASAIVTRRAPPARGRDRAHGIEQGVEVVGRHREHRDPGTGQHGRERPGEHFDEAGSSGPATSSAAYPPSARTSAGTASRAHTIDSSARVRVTATKPSPGTHAGTSAWAGSRATAKKRSGEVAASGPRPATRRPGAGRSRRAAGGSARRGRRASQPARRGRTSPAPRARRRARAPRRPCSAR